MNSLAQTIDQTLRNIGAEPRDLLFETLAVFETLDLPDEERVSAIATAIASSAVAFHNRHVDKYCEAIQVWALELAGNHRAPARLRDLPESQRIAEGAERLVTGLQQLLEMLDSTQIALGDRLVAELTLFSRLLGQHDANTIHLALHSVRDIVLSADFRPGDLVTVPLRMPALLGRDARLEDLQIRGVA